MKFNGSTGNSSVSCKPVAYTGRDCMDMCSKYTGFVRWKSILNRWLKTRKTLTGHPDSDFFELETRWFWSGLLTR